MLWPRSLSAMCPPCPPLCLPWFWPHVVICRAIQTLPARVRRVLRQPCVRLVSLEAALPHLQTLSVLCWPPLFVGHVPALWQLKSTMCHRLWTLFARGLLWGRAVASWRKILFQHCATHRVYTACPLVSFLGIHFGSPKCWYNSLHLSPGLAPDVHSFGVSVLSILHVCFSVVMSALFKHLFTQAWWSSCRAAVSWFSSSLRSCWGTFLAVALVWLLGVGWMRYSTLGGMRAPSPTPWIGHPGQ